MASLGALCVCAKVSERLSPFSVSLQVLSVLSHDNLPQRRGARTVF